jgi:hypothetical protein
MRVVCGWSKKTASLVRRGFVDGIQVVVVIMLFMVVRDTVCSLLLLFTDKCFLQEDHTLEDG